MTDPLSCLRASTIVIAIWNIIYALIQCGIMGWQTQVVKNYQWEWENRQLPATGAIDGFQARFPGLYAIYTETPERRRINAMYAVVLINVILAILHLFFSVALLYGAIKSRRSFIWPWFFTAAPIIIMSTVYAVLWWAGDVFNEQLTMSVAEFVMSLALNGICFVLVCFYFKRLSGTLTSNRPAGRRYSAHKDKDAVPPWRTNWGEKPPHQLAKKLRRKSRERSEKDEKTRWKVDYERRAKGRTRARPPRPQPLPTTLYGSPQNEMNYMTPPPFDMTFPWRTPLPPPPPPMEREPLERRGGKRTAAEVIQNLYYEHYPEELPDRVGDLRRERHTVL